ncbi:MAG TPA: acetate/propionate family kinase [Burkholderiaceae bacterium]|nr:acetate/propionate family kinase [Burkholderiaceae bacterium]
MADLILALNCGSSSIKFALFEAFAGGVQRAAVWQGKVEDLHGPAPTIEHSGAGPEPLQPGHDNTAHRALLAIRERLDRQLGGGALRAVAHRVVHGGTRHLTPVRVDREVLDDLRACTPLAPLHQRPALDAIELLLQISPALPQVACFDTAFHQTMPLAEQMLPLPREAFDRGLRRYGFHGLSYEYQAIVLKERRGAAAPARLIVAHLGSGASLCALRDLRSVSTTMGFSALDGLMMGTRCGSLDPGAVLHLLQVDGMTPAQVSQLLYHEAGLTGVSGVSGDPRVLLEHEQGDERVRLALEMYVRRIVREIGALTAALGGLDMLVFTAGIGEHNAEIRRRVCSALDHLGVGVDAAANRAHAPTISSAASRVEVLIEPAAEEWVAARHAWQLLTSNPGPP